jgi:hypothetical protein
MARSWTIVCGAVSHAASGFAHVANAHDHTQRHFLEPSEAWETICSAPGPIEFRAQLAAAPTPPSPQASAILASAADRYEEIVAQNTALVVRMLPYIDASTGGKRIGVVSAAGFFAVFSDDALSDLRTAYRPTVRGVKRPTLQDFVNGAHHELTKQIGRNERK